jgi:serine/threonine protein phosphatase PrpC
MSPPQAQSAPSVQPTVPPPSSHVGRKLPSPAVPELEAAGATSVGRERPSNEDQFLIAMVRRTIEVRSTTIAGDIAPWLASAADGMLLMVADGMGGQGGGEIASAVAVRAVTEYLCSILPWFDTYPVDEPPPARDSLPGVRDGLASALTHGDEEIQRAANRPGASPKMGTTLTMAYLRPPLAYVAHVGDSRCYLWRRGALRQITRDHTVAEQMQERIGERISESSPWRHVLWNALGAGRTNPLLPELHRAELQPGDTLLLCSDGLNKHVSDARVAELMGVNATVSELCAELVRQADAGGGSDNATVVAARWHVATPV